VGDERSVRVLLELGADPNAGARSGLDDMCNYCGCYSPKPQIIAALLQHGIDCLLPAENSLLVRHTAEQSMHTTAALMLAHLELQRAAGKLELGSAPRAAQLLLAATRMGHE
jgi:hypothetical protein